MTQLDIDLLPDPVLVVDADRRLNAWNTAATTVLGPLDGLEGPLGEALDLRGPTGEPVFRGDWPEPDGSIEWTATHTAGGGDIALSVTVQLVDGNGEPDGAVLLARPVGDRSGIAIVSTVSHELRSPLTSVKGYTSLMLNRWDRLQDEQKLAMLEQVHHDADRVTRLVTELLDISRLETGRLILRRQLVDLHELAESIVEKVAMSYPELECTLDFEDPFPRVYADPDKVEQVVTNLVENAAKYADPTGMTIEGRAGEGRVTIAVHDQGDGIPSDDLPKIFTKFFRRDHGKPTGTGLGLWISRGLAEAHGGSLEVTSSSGDGSTFTFTLPLDAFEELHGVG